MTELQKLLERFLAGKIGLDELQQQFALLLADDSDLPMSAATWLDAGEKDGRLSATVCRSLKSALESHLAAAYVDPEPEFSDIFAAPDESDVDLPTHEEPEGGSTPARPYEAGEHRPIPWDRG